MSDSTPNGNEHASVDRILHHTAQLVRPLAYDDIDPILDLADTVYSCWSFQIDVLTATYEGNQAYLHEVDVTAEDIRATAKLPKSHKLSPMAFWSPDGVNRYGPGELLPARSGREAATRYTLNWTHNGGAYSILIGDIAATVARWRLNSRNLEYSQLTRTVPDDRSWQLCQKIVRWQDQYRNLVPQGMSLHPSEAIEYLRHLPVFTDALNALLAFDRHTPTAVVPEDARATRESIRKHDHGAAPRRADLSIREAAKPIASPAPTPTEQKTDTEHDGPGRSRAPDAARPTRKEQVSIETFLKETADNEPTDDAPAIS